MTVATLPQTYASPSYSYATGSSLNIQDNPQSFFGISDIVTLDEASFPLDFSTVKMTQPMSPKRNFRMSSVQTTVDFHSAFSASAEAQGSYGGFSGSASAKYMQSKTLTSTTSLYMMFYENQLGTVYLNSDAKLTKSAADLLLKDPYQFATVYGRYYVYGATIGCQASSTVTLTAKSEYDKTSLDIAAKASYKDMFSASANFTAQMKSQTGFRDLSVEIFTYGGDVPAVVTTIAEVKTKILDALDTGGKCSSENAIVSQAMVRSWLAFQAVTDMIPQNPQIVKALSPNVTIAASILSRLNNLIMKTRTLVNVADKCHHNVFSCVTKQWNEPTATRQKYYTGALKNLTELQDRVDRVTEADLADTHIVLEFETLLENIYLTWLKPAEALTPFEFTFTIRVLNWYDDYSDPPPYGTNGQTGTFTIDPNHEDTGNEIVWAIQPQIDDGHSNCRHFYGNFHASYKTEELFVWQTWTRVCGSSATTEKVTFYPGGDNKGTADYDGTVRTVYSFVVTYQDQCTETDGFCAAY